MKIKRAYFYFYILFTLSLVCLSTNSIGQIKFSDNLTIATNYQAGYNLREYSIFTLVTNDYIRSFELAFIKQTNGDNVWERTYNKPAHGISLFYSTLGNNDILGKEFAANYFVKVFMFRSKKVKLFNVTGVGLGYVNKIFSIEDNYLNVLVGSHFNIHFNMRFGTSYSLTKRLNVNGGLSFDHISNANTGSPNVGINTFTAYGGLSYKIGEHHFIPDTIDDKHYPKNLFFFFTGFGGKHTESLSATYYFTSSLSFEAKRTITRAFHLGLGADVFYDSSVESLLQKMDRSHKGFYDFQTGIHISETVVYNKFSLGLQQGVYLGFKEQVGKNIIYNKGIMQYNVMKNINIRVVMKSHLHILDYPEIGVGVQF